MKKLLLLLLSLIGLNQSVLCQGFNYTYSLNHTNVATGIAAGESGEWLIGGYRGGYGVTPYLGLSFVEPNEEQLQFFDNGVFLENSYSEIMNISNIDYDTIDDRYYMVVGLSGCDFGLPDQLITMREGGLPLLPSVVDIPESSFISDYILSVVPGQGVLLGSNVAYEESKISLYHDDLFSDILTWGNTNPIRKIAYWFNNRFVVLAESTLSVVGYTLVENSGEILQEVTLNEGVALEPLNDTTLLVLRSTTLEVRDVNLELLQQLEFPNATHLAIDESYIYVIAGDGIHFLNHNLEEVALIALDELNNGIILGASARAGRVGIVGASDFNYSAYSFIKPSSNLFAKTYTIAGADFAPTTDIAITNVEHATVNVYLSPYDAGCMTAYADDIEVTVKNEGNTDLSEVIFTFTEDGCDGWFICPIWVAKSWAPISVNLAPGQSTTVNLGSLVASYIPESSSFNLCIQAYAAEGTTENNVSNNSKCSSSLVVDTEEVAAGAGFKLYPTICQDQLMLSLSGGTEAFEWVVVYNLFGQSLLNIRLPIGQLSVPLEVSHLPAGSYYLRLEGKSVSQALPFVKQ